MKNSTVQQLNTSTTKCHQGKLKAPFGGLGACLGGLFLTLLPTLLSAQNGITISKFEVSAGSVTFNVSWQATGMPTVWLDSAWVFVDYNVGGVMKRLPLNTGATLTETSAPGVGKVIAIPGNNQGVWVVGKTRNTLSSFSATVGLPFNPATDVKGACAYASNYPPLGRWNDEGTLLTLTGTPPYILQLTSATGSRTETVLGSTYTLPGGYTLDTFTDKTGAPGILRCKPSTEPSTLTASVATICSGETLTLTAGGGLDGSGALFQWGSGVVGTAGIIGQGAANTFSAAATVSTTGAVTYWVRRISTEGCAPTAAATATVMVNVAPLITLSDNTFICSGSTTTLTVTTQPGSGSISSYLWKKNGSDAPNTNNMATYITEALVAQTSYTVRVTNTNSCSTTSGNIVVSINPLPTISLPSNNNQSVTPGVAISAITYSTTGATTATVSPLPSGISGVYASNTVTITGSSTVSGSNAYTVTATNTATGCSVTASGTISIAASTPPGAKTTTTWVVSAASQTWSDVIRLAVPGCTSTTNLSTSNPPPAQYRAAGNADYGFYYNWTCVNNYATILCPSPWRVPTSSDFCKLDKALFSTTTCQNGQNLTGYAIYNGPEWGGSFMGMATGSSINNTTDYAGYWSNSILTENIFASAFSYMPTNVNSASTQRVYFALTVRCVK